MVVLGYSRCCTGRDLLWAGGAVLVGGGLFWLGGAVRGEGGLFG
jgi:hypothetical protein